MKFWNRPEELAGLVSFSLSKTIKMYPAVGWVRADKVASEDLLSEIHQLRKESEELLRQEQVKSSRTAVCNQRSGDIK